MKKTILLACLMLLFLPLAASAYSFKKDSLILAMIIGIVIAYLIFALPFIGWVASLLASLWGLGGIVLKLKNK